MVPGGVGLGEVKARGPLLEENGMCELGVKDQLFQVRDNGCMDEQMRQQDSDVLIIEGPIVIIGMAGEVIGLIGRARFIDEFEVKFSHLGQIVRDTVADFLGVVIILQVRVVREDANLMWGSHKEVTPSK
jgi:hypothetical protein